MCVAETAINGNGMYAGADKIIYFTWITGTCPWCLGSSSSAGNALPSVNNPVCVSCCVLSTIPN